MSHPARTAFDAVVGDADAPMLSMASGKMLYLENLTVSFDGFKALDRLTLYVEPGELRCIIGPNGAGKTTMMDVITGKTRPDEGRAWFGRSINLLELRATDCAGGHRPQVPEAERLRVLTVFENLFRSRQEALLDDPGAVESGAARAAGLSSRSSGD